MDYWKVKSVTNRLAKVTFARSVPNSKGHFEFSSSYHFSRELWGFLGMAGYYWSFCPNFPAVEAHLTILLSPSQLFVWKDERQHALDCIQILLSEAPVLSAPDFLKPFKFDVDASAVGLEAILVQNDEMDIEHPSVLLFQKVQ